MNWAHMRAPMIDWLQNNGAAISFIIIGFIFLWTTGLITYMLVSPRGLDEVSLTEMDLEYSKIAHRIDPWLKVGAFVALPISFDIILDAYRFFAKKDEYTSVTELVARTVLMLSYFVPNVLVLALLQGNRKESAVSILVTIFPLLYGLRIGSNLSIAFGHKLFSSADGREIELYTEARCALILAGIFASYITASAQLKVLGFLCVAFVIILLLDTVVRNLYLHIREMVNGQFKNHHNLIDVLYLAACALSIIAWVVVFAIFVIRTGVMPIHSPTADFIESRLLIAIGNSLVISVIPGIAWRISSDEKHEKLQARLNLIRYVSHEMRSPLNTAFLGLKLIMDELNSMDLNLTRFLSAPHYLPLPRQSTNSTIDSHSLVHHNELLRASISSTTPNNPNPKHNNNSHNNGHNNEDEFGVVAGAAGSIPDVIASQMIAQRMTECLAAAANTAARVYAQQQQQQQQQESGLESGVDTNPSPSDIAAVENGQLQQQQRRIRRRSVLNVTQDRHESFISIHRASLSASVSAPDSSSSHTSPRSSHASYASYTSAAVGAVLASTVPTALSPNLAAGSTMGAAGRTVGSSNTGEDMPRKEASMASGLYRIDSVFKFSSSSNSSSAPSSSCTFSALPSAAAGAAEVIGGGSPPSKVLAVDRSRGDDAQVRGSENPCLVSGQEAERRTALAEGVCVNEPPCSDLSGTDAGTEAGRSRGESLRGVANVSAGLSTNMRSTELEGSALLENTIATSAPAPAAAPAALAGGQEEREDRGAEIARRAELLRVVGSIVTAEQCAELLETADLVRSSCQVALETLNDLLTYDKMDEKKLEVELEEINPWQLVNDTAKPFRINAEKQNVNLIVSCTDLLLEENWARDFVILADRFKFSQVVRNLVSNALKFTPARGTVKVQVEKLLNYPGSGVKRLRRKRLAAPAAAASATSRTQPSPDSAHAVPPRTGSRTHPSASSAVASIDPHSISNFSSPHPPPPPQASQSRDARSQVSDGSSVYSRFTAGTAGTAGTVRTVETAAAAVGGSGSEAGEHVRVRESIADRDGARRGTGRMNRREGAGEYLLRINVIDTGRGISAENQRKLFGQYVQFKAGEHQQGNGSGLGLWIAKNIVQLHGGTIRALSEGEGCGTTFRIELPLYPVDERRRHRRRRHSQSHSQSQIQSQRNAHTQEQPHALSGRAALLDELDASLESGTSSNNNISHVSHISHASRSTQSTGAELVVAPHSMEVTQHQQQHDSEVPSPLKGGPKSGIVRTFTPPSTRSLATFQREAERIAAVADASGAAGGESQESVGSVAVAGADAEHEVVAMCSANPQSVGLNERDRRDISSGIAHAGIDAQRAGSFRGDSRTATANTGFYTLDDDSNSRNISTQPSSPCTGNIGREELIKHLDELEASASQADGATTAAAAAAAAGLSATQEPEMGLQDLRQRSERTAAPPNLYRALSSRALAMLMGNEGESSPLPGSTPAQISFSRQLSGASRQEFLEGSISGQSVRSNKSLDEFDSSAQALQDIWRIGEEEGRGGGSRTDMDRERRLLITPDLTDAPSHRPSLLETVEGGTMRDEVVRKQQERASLLEREQHSILFHANGTSAQNAHAQGDIEEPKVGWWQGFTASIFIPFRSQRGSVHSGNGNKSANDERVVPLRRPFEGGVGRLIVRGSVKGTKEDKDSSTEKHINASDDTLDVFSPRRFLNNRVKLSLQLPLPDLDAAFSPSPSPSPRPVPLLLPSSHSPSQPATLLPFMNRSPNGNLSSNNNNNNNSSSYYSTLCPTGWVPTRGLRLRSQSSDDELYHSLSTSPRNGSIVGSGTNDLENPDIAALDSQIRVPVRENSQIFHADSVDGIASRFGAKKDGESSLEGDNEESNLAVSGFLGFLTAGLFRRHSSNKKYIGNEQAQQEVGGIRDSGIFERGVCKDENIGSGSAVAGYDLERGEASEGVFTQGTTGFELSHEASDGSALSVWDSEGSVKVETSSRVKRNAAGRCMTQRMMMQGKIFPSAVGVDDVSVPDRDDTSIAHIHHGDARKAAVVTPQRSLSLSHQHPSRKSITSCWATGPLRVLLVDDVALSRRMCRKILTRFGHSIFEASDGIEAVELIQRCIADLHASENRANVDQDDEDNGNNDCNVRNNTGDAEAPLIIKNGEALSPLPTSYLSRMNSRRSSDATVVQRGSGMFFSRISGPRRDSTGSNASITARISAPASERAAIRSGRSGSKSRSSSLARRDCGHIDAMDLGDCAGEYEEGGGIEETEGGEGDYLSLETSRENGISEEASMGWIDLVLMDDSMPRMSGTEATRALRELGYDGLICGLSGDIHADKVQLFLDCGADFVLGKPLSVTELENLVTAALVPASAALVQHQDHEQQQQHLHRQRRGETE